MKLIIQPDEGVNPVVQAIRKAKKTADVVIFRFDHAQIEKALVSAVKRGVLVRALIAHTNRGGEKSLYVDDARTRVAWRKGPAGVPPLR